MSGSSQVCGASWGLAINNIATSQLLVSPLTFENLWHVPLQALISISHPSNDVVSLPLPKKAYTKTIAIQELLPMLKWIHFG